MLKHDTLSGMINFFLNFKATGLVPHCIATYFLTMRSEISMEEMLMICVLTMCGLTDKCKCFGWLRQPFSVLKMETVCSFEMF